MEATAVVRAGWNWFAAPFALGVKEASPITTSPATTPGKQDLQADTISPATTPGKQDRQTETETLGPPLKESVVQEVELPTTEFHTFKENFIDDLTPICARYPLISKISILVFAVLGLSHLLSLNIPTGVFFLALTGSLALAVNKGGWKITETAKSAGRVAEFCLAYCNTASKQP